MGQIAARQHGIVSIRQLHSLGLGRNAVSLRVRAGRLHRVHQGVYAVGHLPSAREARWMAAVLACGKHDRAQPYMPILGAWGAAISHRSAAELWDLLPRADGPIDVSVPGYGGKRRRRGLRLHRSISLLPADVTLRSGIPVTRAARTIADLRQAVAHRRAGAVTARELRRAVRQADVLGLPIAEVPGRDRTRSDLERDFLRLCRRHHLPAPEVNVRTGPDLVDFLWRERRVVVETDGYLYHRGRQAFEDDRERDLRLRVAGFDALRFSEKQLEQEPRQVAEALARALRVGADGDQAS